MFTFISLTPLDVTPCILQGWTSRTHVVELHIYKYGANVQTSAHFTSFQGSVLDPAEVDRAGSASNMVVAGIALQLKERWGSTYASESINWQIWANAISTKPAFQHGALIDQPPPQNLIHLFRRSPTDDTGLIRVLRSDNSASVAIIDDIDHQLADIVKSFQTLRASLARHRQTAIALRAAMNPDEYPDSALDIPNILDVDHQEQD